MAEWLISCMRPTWAEIRLDYIIENFQAIKRLVGNQVKILAALKADPQLSQFGGRVSDSGEGRWTLRAAIDMGVPAPVLSSALFDRFSSQGHSEFADKILSAMRYAFGGHVEKPKA